MRQLLDYKIVRDKWSLSLEDQVLVLSREGYELWAGPFQESYLEDGERSTRLAQAMVKWGPESTIPWHLLK